MHLAPSSQTCSRVSKTTLTLQVDTANAQLQHIDPLSNIPCLAHDVHIAQKSNAHLRPSQRAQYHQEALIECLGGEGATLQMPSALQADRCGSGKAARASVVCPRGLTKLCCRSELCLLCPRVGITLSNVEVRWQDLDIETDVFVGSRALPSVTNAFLDYAQV